MKPSGLAPYLAVLGNTPALSALELGQTWTGGQVVFLEDCPNLQRLGGTIKIAETWFTVPHTLVGIEKIKTELERIAADTKKIPFGFSVYAHNAHIKPAAITQCAKKLARLGITWKKELRAKGYTARYVASREPALSSVIVTREHLLQPQTDFVIVIGEQDITVGRTLAVQDYHAFSERDYGRPGHDRLAGMLPPKVARMMVNIMNPAPTATILDPFCGSGTILQEALGLGHQHVLGSDISQKAMSDTAANLAWLKLKPTELYMHDALKLETVIAPQSIDCIITEGYLGPVRPTHIHDIQTELTTFYTAVWQVFARILKPQGRVIMALPAWKRPAGIATLPLTNIIPPALFTQWSPPLIYGREDAMVVRHIVMYTKKIILNN